VLMSSVERGPAPRRERLAKIRLEMHIHAAAADVFSFLIDPTRMKLWLAPAVLADPRPGGAFQLSDFNGQWIEGLYLELVAYERIVLTWGGIEGLRIGESIVDFRLRSDAAGTALRLLHSCLPQPALGMHEVGWREWGLPKLKAVAEGGEPRGTYLGAIAEAREQFAYCRDNSSSIGFSSAT